MLRYFSLKIWYWLGCPPRMGGDIRKFKVPGLGRPWKPDEV